MSTVRRLDLGAFALLALLLGCDKGTGTAGPVDQAAAEVDSAPSADPEQRAPAGPPAREGESRPTSPTEPGEVCGDERCEAPATCIEYYGIAGASGPKFQSCEVRCKGPEDRGCPEGTRCVTVADGPGQVCR